MPAAALLFGIEGAIKLKRKELPDDIACTDRTMAWHQPPRNFADKLTKPLKVSEIVFKQPEYGKESRRSASVSLLDFEPRSLEDHEKDEAACEVLLRAVASSCPTSGLFHFHNFDEEHRSLVTGQPATVATLDSQAKKLIVSVQGASCPGMDELDIAGEVFRTTCLEYADSQGIAPEVVSYVEQVTTDQSANDLWKALHNGRITSSSFHDVLVRKTTTAPDRLVKKLMGYTSFHGTPATRHGLTHEDPARQQYVAFMNKTGHQGISVTPSGLSLYQQFSFLGASADGYILDPAEEDLGILEIKCPFSINNKDVTRISPIEIAERYPAEFCLEIRADGTVQLKRMHRYYTQIQGELAVKGKRWADFVVWTQSPADNLFIERVTADNSFWESKLLLKLCNFYTTVIVPEVLLRRVQRGLPLLRQEEHITPADVGHS